MQLRFLLMLLMLIGLSGLSLACGDDDNATLLDWRTAPSGPCVSGFSSEPTVVDSLVAVIYEQKLDEDDAALFEDAATEWYDEYRALPAGLPESTYDLYFRQSEVFECQAWLLHHPQYR